MIVSKEFRRSEIIQHNKKDDCWIILFNKVYDDTDFIRKHPGGSEILLSRAGEDASSFFQTRHGRNSQIYKHLEAYKIGKLVEEEKVEDTAFDENFLEELIQICQKRKLFFVDKAKKRNLLGLDLF